MPEFASLILERAKIIKKRPKRNKLYVFVVTSLNSEATGESDVRLQMVNNFDRNDLDAGDEEFEEQQTERFQKELHDRMVSNGVMVHICQLKSSRTTKNWLKKYVTDYQNVYVHAKVSFYDNAYLLLGSANWNLRSMTQDSELDIAIECHDGGVAGLSKRFREHLWNAHLPLSYSYDDPKSKMYIPADWYDQWGKLLSKNWALYKLKKNLIMNLFPYYEDITSLNKKMSHPINTIRHPISNMSQGSG